MSEPLNALLSRVNDKARKFIDSFSYRSILDGTVSITWDVTTTGKGAYTVALVYAHKQEQIFRKATIEHALVALEKWLDEEIASL